MLIGITAPRRYLASADFLRNTEQVFVIIIIMETETISIIIGTYLAENIYTEDNR